MMNKPEGYSVVLLKPDSNHLPEADRAKLRQLVCDYAGENLLTTGDTLSFNSDDARALWGPSVHRYPWAEDYYACMSGNAMFYVVAGAQSGQGIKKQVREDMQETIESLKKRLRTSFSPDLIHASDPKCEDEELCLLLNIMLRENPNLRAI